MIRLVTQSAEDIAVHLKDYRWSALARYHDATIEAGVALIALSRMPMESHWGIATHFGSRFTVRVMTDMHQFSFNSRKAIEIADAHIGEVEELARKIKPDGAGEVIEIEPGEKITLSDADFWWSISRIIHSQQVHVQDIIHDLEATENRIYSVRNLAYFGFRSDKDEVDMMHFVSIEGLVSLYIEAIAPRVEEAIRRRLQP